MARSQENLVRTIEMESAGIEVHLHERSCVNCQRTYRCLPSSTQMTCSKQCQIDAELDPKKRQLALKQALIIKQQKAPPDPCFHVPPPPKDNAPPGPKVVKLTPLQEMEAKWKRYVTAARVLVSSMHAYRMDIAKMALEICDIKQGGGAHWSEFKDVYTLKKFAEEIGITYKTLHGWCRVKRNVIDKLPSGHYDDKTDWYAAVQTSNRTTKKTSPEKIKKLFDKWKSRGSQDHYLLQLHRRVKSGSYFVHHRARLEMLDASTLKELKNNAQSIVNDINKFFRGDK